MTWVDTLFRDLVYGARMLRRQPGTTFLAVLTLSLGIGANTVIYSLLHAALIRPLPFPSSQRLVAVVDDFVTENRFDMSPTIPETLDVRAATRRSTAAASRCARSRRASKRTFSAHSACSPRSAGSSPSAITRRDAIAS